MKYKIKVVWIDDIYFLFNIDINFLKYKISVKERIVKI